MGLLTGIIPAQKFETIRDRIAQILTLELVGQAYMLSPVGEIPSVFVARYTAIDESEGTVINVNLQQGDFDNKDQRFSDGAYLFNIDVYTAADSTPSARGDNLATVAAHRWVGMCRAILENPQYRTLGFTPPSISRVWVSAIRTPENQNLQDGTNAQQIRLEFYVRVAESVELITPTELVNHFTTVKLSSTEKGYKYEYAAA